jgi:hypothetical protein
MAVHLRDVRLDWYSLRWHDIAPRNRKAGAPVTAWLLVGALGMGCGLLAWFVRMQAKLIAALRAAHESELSLARAEKDMLLRTALDAKGVIVREQSATSPQIAEAVKANLRARVAGRLSELEREDAEKAIDRDARVAREIEEANRIARGRGADA